MAAAAARRAAVLGAVAARAHGFVAADLQRAVVGAAERAAREGRAAVLRFGPAQATEELGHAPLML